MKIFNKFSKLSKRKKITLLVILIILIICTISAGVIIYKSTNNNDISANIPDVNLENTEFEISETEITCDDVIVTAVSKIEGYNLYYYINQIIEPEETQVDEIDNKDSLKDKEKQNKSNSVNVAQENTEVIEETESVTEISNEEYTLYEDIISVEENSIIYFKYELDGIYSENSYTIEINNIEKSGETSEEATEEELESERIKTTDTKAKYYIKVNVTANVVTVYGKDSNNEYTEPVKAMVCSTGKATPTSGVYKTRDKYKWRLLFGNVYGQYATRIVGSILFHSVPYIKADNGSLEYWEYDKLGTAASLGCVRLTVADALWIYNNCEKGTQVEFYSSSNPGPLGKPTAQKISGEEFRDWDPTDPISTNPWITGVLPPKSTSDTSAEPPAPTSSDPVPSDVNTNTDNTNIDGNSSANEIGNTVISEHIHDYKLSSTQLPTCTEPGEEISICSSCDQKDTKPIKAKGHEYVSDRCTICGAQKPEPLPPEEGGGNPDDGGDDVDDGGAGANLPVEDDTGGG